MNMLRSSLTRCCSSAIMMFVFLISGSCLTGCANAEPPSGRPDTEIRGTDPNPVKVASSITAIKLITAFDDVKVKLDEIGFNEESFWDALKKKHVVSQAVDWEAALPTAPTIRNTASADGQAALFGSLIEELCKSQQNAAAEYFMITAADRKGNNVSVSSHIVDVGTAKLVDVEPRTGLPPLFEIRKVYRSDSIVGSTTGQDFANHIAEHLKALPADRLISGMSCRDRRDIPFASDAELNLVGYASKTVASGQPDFLTKSQKFESRRWVVLISALTAGVPVSYRSVSEELGGVKLRERDDTSDGLVFEGDELITVAHYLQRCLSDGGSHDTGDQEDIVKFLNRSGHGRGGARLAREGCKLEEVGVSAECAGQIDFTVLDYADQSGLARMIKRNCVEDPIHDVWLLDAGKEDLVVAGSSILDVDRCMRPTTTQEVLLLHSTLEKSLQDYKITVRDKYTTLNYQNEWSSDRGCLSLKWDGVWKASLEEWKVDSGCSEIFVKDQNCNN